MSEMVKRTWEELGCKVRPHRTMVFIRTEPLPEKSPGGIFYAPTAMDFYDGPMHMRLINATILSVGSEVKELQPGMRICFQRKCLARWKFMQDGTLVGWLQLGDVTGILEEGLAPERFMTFPEGPKAVRMGPT